MLIRKHRLTIALPLIAATLLAIAPSKVIAQTPPPAALADLESVVQKELERWKVPGASVAIVHDGKIVLTTGYGFRDQEKKLAMTANTVQPIASVTKSFTVAALGTLVRDGKLSWDKPVRDYMSDFRTSNDYVTLNATPRDLVTHRTGLPRHDASWFGSTATREELYRRVRHLEFSAQLRERWQYNNFMYMTAGYLGGRVAGTTWEELVKQNLFGPLNMPSSSFTIEDLKAVPDHGTPYKHDNDDKPTAITYQGLPAMGPTGSINSNARDMANYLLMYVNRGQYQGKRVLNEADVIEMTNPQMVLPDARRFAEIGAAQYGMGFFLTTYRGERLVHHGGNMPGSSSLLSFLPQKNMGVFVSVNMSGSTLPTIISYAIYDRLLGLQPIDWSSRLKQIDDLAKAAAKTAREGKLAPRKPNTKPTHALADYAGQYEHAGYGVISVANVNDALTVSYNGMSSPFNHYHFDVFQAPYNQLNELSEMKLQFITDMNGDVSALAVQMEPSVKPAEFKRLPDKRFKDASFLKRFVADYQLPGLKAAIALRDDGVLTLSIPGQAVRELSGVIGQRFAMKGLDGYFVEFLNDAAGNVERILFLQPTGNSVANRIK